MESLLSIRDLVVKFRTETGTFAAVRGFNLDIAKGQTVGLVGESGSGKSVTAMSILGLIPQPPGIIEANELSFAGQSLLNMSETAMRKIRGNKISMIFQEPMTSLNPVFTIGDQISEVFRVHRGMNKKEARDASIEMLSKVKIPAPEKRVDEYPHQLSGGMRQRVMIAMALACNPELLIADEPTTALDVTIQAQILDLIQELQEELNMAVLLITHDMGVVAEFCKQVIVMYAGRVVEAAPVEKVFENPSHPYTKGLLASIPKLGHRVSRLATIPGTVPALGKFPSGCTFQNRCEFAVDQCRLKAPDLVGSLDSHAVACFETDKVTMTNRV